MVDVSSSSTKSTAAPSSSSGTRAEEAAASRSFSAVSPRIPHVAIECDALLSTFRCLICLEDLPFHTASKALRCAHLVCNECQRDFWTHSVEKDSEPFPSCALRGCGAHASYRALSAQLPVHVMRRVRHLQALKPTRAIDGRPMYCVRPGCLEPLPPPPPLPPRPEAPEPPLQNDTDENAGEGGDGNLNPVSGAEEGDANDHAAEANVTDISEGLVTTCPECTQEACLRCGTAAHVGTNCAVPLANERQTRLYRQYAVGRLGACPRCGVHIARDGGCSRVRCTRCAFEFDFVPFRTTDDVAEAALELEEGSIAPEAVGPPPPGLAMYFMFWGAGFSCMPLITMFDNLTKGANFFITVMLLPFVCFGVPTFFGACAAYITFIYQEIVPLFGRADGVDAHRAIGMAVMACSFVLMSVFLTRTFVPMSSWVSYVYLPPFVVFPSFLVSFLILHYTVICIRTLLRRHDQWGPIDADGDQFEREVGADRGDRAVESP